MIHVKKILKKKNSLFIFISYEFHNYIEICFISNMRFSEVILQIISHGFIGSDFFLVSRIYLVYIDEMDGWLP